MEVLRENRALRSEVARLTALLAAERERVWVGRVVGETVPEPQEVG